MEGDRLAVEQSRLTVLMLPWPIEAKGQQTGHPWLQNSQPQGKAWGFKHGQKQHMQVSVLKQLNLSLGERWFAAITYIFGVTAPPLSLQSHLLNFCCILNPPEVRKSFLSHKQLLWKWAQHPRRLQSERSDLIALPGQAQTPTVNVQMRNK